MDIPNERWNPLAKAAAEATTTATTVRATTTERNVASVPGIDYKCVGGVTNGNCNFEYTDTARGVVCRGVKSGDGIAKTTGCTPIK